MIVVRRIRPEQLDTLHLLQDAGLVSEEAVLTVSRSGLQLTYRPLPQAAWRAFPPVDYADPYIIVQDPGSAFYGAWAGDEYIGCAAVTTGPNGWAELLDLRVEPAFRRQGAGRMLLEACDRFAEKRGLPGLKLTVTDANAGLCQFLEHMQFELGGFDRLALSMTPEERTKPISRRAGLLFFYRKIKKG